MNRRTRLATPMAVVSALALALAACGDDDDAADETAAPAASAPASTAGAPTTVATTAAVTTEEPATTPDTAAADASDTTASATGGGDPYPVPPSVAPATTGPAPATTGAAAPSGDAVVEVAATTIGDVLASEGRTLYIFTPDEGADVPTCTEGCADAWPPLIVDGSEVAVGEGLDAAQFGTIARDDGEMQVTVGGWPLYFFANDGAPGDVNGQGVGDVWYVVGPDGEIIRD